jgi:hypothetical protein
MVKEKKDLMSKLLESFDITQSKKPISNSEDPDAVACKYMQRVFAGQKRCAAELANTYF